MWDNRSGNNQISLAELDQVLNDDRLGAWGKKMAKLYRQMAYEYDEWDNPWWIADGDFTLSEFYALIVYYEHNGTIWDGSEYWSNVSEVMTYLFAYEGVTDRSQAEVPITTDFTNRITAFFNVIGTMESARDRIENRTFEAISIPEKYTNILELAQSAFRSYGGLVTYYDPYGAHNKKLIGWANKTLYPGAGPFPVGQSYNQVTWRGTGENGLLFMNPDQRSYWGQFNK
jgi:hypothetical protein